MGQKSDDVQPALPNTGIVVARRASDELDDAETTAIVAISVEALGADRVDANLADSNAHNPHIVTSVQPEDDEALAPGFLLRDRFEIVELVHSGGMGHVYKAIDKRRHLRGHELSHVAIKMMRRSVAPHLDARIALERESAKAQRLSHPNVINVYDFDEHDGQFFLVMEWLEGETVNALLRRTSGRRLEPQFAWLVIRSIAAGVQHAHLNNVVHADINPSNVFITDTQEVKLLDFGAARNCGDPLDSTVAKIVWATRTYASPEVLSGFAPVFEDDIFSLGCVAYRLLSGKHPFGSLSSIEARQAGLSVPPISGLTESEAQTLNRALAFNRSDRPRTAEVFSTAIPAASESVAALRLPQIRLPANLLRMLLLAVIAFLAGMWWLWQGSLESEEPPIEASTLVEDKPTVAADPTSAIEEPGRLLSSATTAMDEGRLLAPVDNNARDFYRQVLQSDSANPIALGGLRAISDVYVQRANTELRAGAPEPASAALAIAAETDPGNPAIAIVNELLLAQGNRQLAAARLAVADGDYERAAELLAVAKRYPHLDVKAISDQLAQYTPERQFQTQLEAADKLIVAGQLTAPTGDNALALLLKLKQDHATDSRLVASMESLGARLLTHAASATSVDRFSEADELLDAVLALGVLSPELEAAQATLLRAEETAVNALIPPSASAESALDELAAPSLIEGGEPEQASTPDLATRDLASLPALTPDVPGPTPDAAANSGTALTDEPSEAKIFTVSELGIEKYVAPKFPRSAQRRGLTGFADVEFSVYPDGSIGAIKILNSEPGKAFDASAENAVKQWRFTPRDDEVRGSVRLSFALKP